MTLKLSQPAQFKLDGLRYISKKMDHTSREVVITAPGIAEALNQNPYTRYEEREMWRNLVRTKWAMVYNSRVGIVLKAVKVDV